MTCNRDVPCAKAARSGSVAELRGRVARRGAFAASILGLAFAAALPAIADSADPRLLLARSLTALDEGNASAARMLAGQAVAADQNWGLAHAVLARTALALGDGATAEAELGRATQAGFDPARTHQLLAHARLLQHDGQGAVREARLTAPRYAAYGRRIQARALAALGDPAAADALLKQVAAARPNDAGLWTDIGRLRLSVGDTVGAIQAADRAVALDGNATDALLLRAQLVRTQFGLTAALPWYEAALKRDPQRYDILIDYAATLGDAGRATDMLAATRRALAVRPDSPQALYLLAVLAARAGNADLARDMLGKAGERLDGMPGALLLGATLDLDSGDDHQAIARLRNLVGIQPMNLRARQLLGLALLRTGNAREARDVLRPLALRADADSYTLTLVARAFEATGERDWAAHFLDRASVPAVAASATFGSDDGVPALAAAARGLAAGEPSTAVPLIRSLLDAGKRDEALARARAVADANRGAAPAALVLGDTLMELGRAGEAADAYARAASIAFDEPVLLRLTEALDLAGRRAEAARALALFRAQNPRNVAAARLAAHWQLAAGDYDAAIDTLEDLRARLGDRDAALLAELAYAHDGAGDADDAASYAAAAYALAPSNPAAADAYGWSLYKAEDYAGARQLLEKAVGIAPRHAILRWHLAQLYAATGRAADARANAMLALHDPRFGARGEAQTLIASLG